MELTVEQKKAVAEWVAKGDSLSEIQKKIISEFHITITYMDLRFMVDDLGVALKDQQSRLSRPTPVLGGKGAPPTDEPEELDEEPAYEPPSAAGGGHAAIELDRIVKAGAVVSGSVTFSDGVKAAWSLDMQGRLALSAGKEGYRPSAGDIRAFQENLSKELRKKGF